MDYVFRWLNGTILATGHGADDPSINIHNWLTYLLDDFLVMPKLLSIFFIVSIFIFLLINIRLIINNKYNYSRKEILTTLITISGILWILLIILNVQRLWGMYLFPRFTSYYYWNNNFN